MLTASLKQKLFEPERRGRREAPLYEVHSDLRDFVLDNLAKSEKQVLDALRIETYTLNGNPSLTASISRTEPTF